jgi:drug/metabolite transporter (DMT)-like permease
MTAHRVLSTAVGTNQEAFSPGDWVRFVSISLIWGSSFLLIALGLESFAPGVVTWLRVGSGAAVLMALPGARIAVAREDRARLVALSVLWVGIPMSLFPIAQQWITSAVTGMLNGAMPIFTAAIASVMLQRLPRPAQTIGLVVGFLGIVAISLPSIGEGRSQALGVGLVVAATLCYGIAVNIATPLQQRYGSLPVMARMLVLATVWTAPLGVSGLAESSFSWQSLLAVLALGVLGTGTAFVIMGTLVGSVGSTRASFITYLIPVVATALGVVLLHERVTGLAVLGTVLVIGGALLASRREAR